MKLVRMRVWRGAVARLVAILQDPYVVVLKQN